MNSVIVGFLVGKLGYISDFRTENKLKTKKEVMLSRKGDTFTKCFNCKWRVKNFLKVINIVNKCRLNKMVNEIQYN